MSKPVIVCADDELIILRSLKDQLTDHLADYVVETVENGMDALDLFRELHASNTDVPVVIADQIMPGMKGNELLREIHRLSPRTLKILLTGQADAKAVGDAVNNAKLYRYIGKPWEEADLVLTVTEAIRSFYQDKQLDEQNKTLQEMNMNLERLVVDRTAEVVQQKEKIQKQLEDNERQRKELEVRNKFITSIFGRYVADDVMMTLLEDPASLKFGGEKRDVTIMMSDLRGFTALSEHLPAEKVMRMLNHYLEVMVEIILSYNGTIIEFMGDGVFAVFGAPKSLPGHAEQAVACTLAMQAAMPSINQYHRENGLPEIVMGIGLNTGEVVVGSIGSEKRAKYGLVGTAVNITARIESFTVGNQILASTSTKEVCGDLIVVGESWPVEMKGIERAMTLYEVHGIGGKYGLKLARSNSMLTQLMSAVPVKAYVVKGKSVSPEAIDATIMQLSHTEAVISSVRPFTLFTDLRILRHDVAEFELYGKVISGKKDEYTVSFTSISAGASIGIRELIGGEQG